MRRSNRRGVNSIEFALILPVFLLLVGGTMEFAWVFWQRTTLVDIVRYGCREGSVISPSDGDPVGEALAAMENWGQVIHKGMACDNESGGYCTVEAEVKISDAGMAELHCTATIEKYAPLLNLGFIPEPRKGVRAVSVIRLELQP